MVRCKFVVEEITKTRHGSHVVKLFPVTGGSEENKTFWKYTPTGSIQFSSINDEAMKQFEVGKEFYVDFTPAEANTGSFKAATSGTPTCETTPKSTVFSAGEEPTIEAYGAKVQGCMPESVTIKVGTCPQAEPIKACPGSVK